MSAGDAPKLPLAAVQVAGGPVVELRVFVTSAAIGGTFPEFVARTGLDAQRAADVLAGAPLTALEIVAVDGAVPGLALTLKHLSEAAASGMPLEDVAAMARRAGFKADVVVHTRGVE